jgi:hypothetical protein
MGAIVKPQDFFVGIRDFFSILVPELVSSSFFLRSVSFSTSSCARRSLAVWVLEHSRSPRSSPPMDLARSPVLAPR